MTVLSRAFLAVYPPADVLDALETRLAAVRALPAAAGMRWVPRDQLHLTLRFCGRVPDADALTDAVHDAARVVPPIDGLALAGAGAFPTPRRATVCWIGVADAAVGATSALGGLAAALEAACVSAGLEPDDRGFRPHVSVARTPRGTDLRALVGALGDASVGPPWSAREVRLVASATRPRGAVHTEVARIPLVGRS